METTKTIPAIPNPPMVEAAARSMATVVRSPQRKKDGYRRDKLSLFLGTTTDYCGVGCQPDFGTCSGSEGTPIDPNLCGPANGNNKCLSGLCCSSAGFVFSLRFSSIYSKDPVIVVTRPTIALLVVSLALEIVQLQSLAAMATVPADLHLKMQNVPPGSVVQLP